MLHKKASTCRLNELRIETVNFLINKQPALPPEPQLKLFKKSVQEVEGDEDLMNPWTGDMNHLCDALKLISAILQQSIKLLIKGNY